MRANFKSNRLLKLAQYTKLIIDNSENPNILFLLLLMFVENVSRKNQAVKAEFFLQTFS